MSEHQNRSAATVDALAKTIWLAEFKRAFDRDPSDPWENQAESSKGNHLNTARKIIEAGFVTGAPAQPEQDLAKHIRSVADDCREDFNTCPQCGYEDGDAIKHSNLLLLIDSALASQPSPAATVETFDVMATIDPDHAESFDRHNGSSAGNADAAKPKELLAIANHIDTGLSRDRDADEFFAPPLSIREWREIVAALRHRAGATNALTSTEPQAAPVTGAREMWAMLYLHDWDPPKAGQEHRWEPGKNIFPEIHAVYETLRDANTILYRMSDPKKYWVRRVWMPAHDTPSVSRPQHSGE